MIVRYKARWWQRRCPYRWGDRGNVWHVHSCRWRSSNGLPHMHVCDCGASREGFDDAPHLQRFDPTTPVGSGTPIYGPSVKPQRNWRPPCRNCDATECGDESWPRHVCCEGCTHGK